MIRREAGRAIPRRRARVTSMIDALFSVSWHCPQLANVEGEETKSLPTKPVMAKRIGPRGHEHRNGMSKPAPANTNAVKHALAGYCAGFALGAVTQVKLIFNSSPTVNPNAVSFGIP